MILNDLSELSKGDRVVLYNDRNEEITETTVKLVCSCNGEQQVKLNHPIYDEWYPRSRVSPWQPDF